MAASKESLAAELDKLKKTEIIDLIIYQKLPPKLSSSEVLCELKNKLKLVSKSEGDSSENDTFFDSHDYTNDANLCTKQICIQIKIREEVHKIKVQSLSDVVKHLEKRIGDLEEIIGLLKNNNKHIQGNSQKIYQNQQAGPSTHQTVNNNSFIKNKSTIAAPPTREKQEININTNSTTDGEKRNFTLNKNNTDKNIISKEQVSNAIKEAQEKVTGNKNNVYSQKSIRYNQRRPIIGTSKKIDCVKSVPKRGYLHLYRLDASTSSESIIKGLSITAPHIPFLCEPLNRTDTTCSMIVSFPIHYVKEVYDPDIWPDGSIVNRFKFRPGGPGGNFNNPASGKQPL